MESILIKNISQLCTVENLSVPVTHSYLDQWKVYQDVSLEIQGERFSRIISDPAEVDVSLYDKVIDAAHSCVVPGFVDSHTHCVFPACRDDEFDLRLKGATYLEILENGGGILSSADKLSRTPEETLLRDLMNRLDLMLSYGTTCVEIKSGYGLSFENEMKILHVIRKAAELHPVDIIPTFMGAHAVPAPYKGNTRGYMDELKKMIDAVAEQKLAAFNDVFCEKGVFSVEESREILLYGISRGLLPKIHADEIVPLGASELAAEIGAVSAEHLLATTDDSIMMLAENGVIANLLPVTALFLMKQPARARKFIQSRCPVAISTDCNPGSSMTESMQLVIAIACLNMKLTIEEALIAATFNAACAVKMQHELGTIEPGKKADCLIIRGDNYRIIPYHIGMNNVSGVVKSGKYYQVPVLKS